MPRVWGLSLGKCFHFPPVSWTRTAVSLYLIIGIWFIGSAFMHLRNILAIILALCTRFNRQTDRWSGGAAGRGRSRRIRGALTDQPGG